MTTFTQKEFITFDCYGTLIDWEDGMRNAISKIVEKNWFTLNLENIANKYIQIELEVEKQQYMKYHKVLQLTIKELLKREGFTISRDDALAFADSIYSWQPFLEVKESLLSLKKKGYKLVHDLKGLPELLV